MFVVCQHGGACEGATGTSALVQNLGNGLRRPSKAYLASKDPRPADCSSRRGSFLTRATELELWLEPIRQTEEDEVSASRSGN